MKPDDETRAFYDRAAIDYADRFGKIGKPDQDLIAFMQVLPPGGHVLDFGCGPGKQSAQMLESDFKVDATDASDGMIATARDRYGVQARKATFDELDAVDRYDGIFANFSLLHAPRAEFPGHLARMTCALKPGGHLHLGLKLGEGEARDELGRFYSYFTEAELTGWLEEAGYTITRTRHDRALGMTGRPSPTILMLARLDG